MLSLRDHYTNLTKFLRIPLIKHKFLSGGIWLSLGSGGENALRLVRNMILTRILVPEAFGVMAIVLSINNLFDAFTQLGIRQAIIQNPRGDSHEYLNGAFWLSVVRGLLLFITAYALAPFIANFYQKQALIPMLRLVMTSILFISVISPNTYVQMRNMNYKRWVIVFHGGSIIGIIITVILGLIMRDIWALAIGFTLENALRAAISYVFCPFFPTLTIDRTSIRELAHFAKGMFGLPVLTFFYDRVDIFVLGKFVADAELGFYSMAKSILYIPYTILSTIAIPLMMPTFSALQRDPEKLRIAIQRSTRITALLFLPGFTFMACFAPNILSAAYGDPYASVGGTFRILCMANALKVMGAVMVTALISIGKPELTRMAAIIRIVFAGFIIIPLVVRFGVNGAALSLLGASIAWFVFIGLNIKKYVMNNVKALIRELSPSIVLSILIATLWLIFFPITNR